MFACLKRQTSDGEDNAEIDGSGPLMLLPDHILTRMFLSFETATDRLRFGAVNRRLRSLTIQRSVCASFQYVKAWCHDDRYDLCCGGRSIGNAMFDKPGKVVASFSWLFNVCQPKLLDLHVNNPPNEVAARAMGELIEALPAKNDTFPIERLSLLLYCGVNSPCKTDLFDSLFRRLPNTLSHIYLHLESLPVELAPSLANWFRSCTRLEIVRLQILSLDEDYPDIPYEPDHPPTVFPFTAPFYKISAVLLDGLESLSSLKGVHFHRDVELLNRNQVACIQHFCCASHHDLRTKCEQLNERARTNITTICCLPCYDETDLSFVLNLFPNCRRMAFGECDYAPQDAPSMETVQSLKAAYQRMQTGDGKEDEGKLLKIIIFVPNLTEPIVERSELVEIRKELASCDDDRCFLRSAMAHSAAKGKLIAVIGDEDTCVGFLLGGTGELNRARKPNYLVVDKNTSVQDIEEQFKEFSSRDDIAVILMNQHIAEMIRYTVDSHRRSVPAVLEIPSKDHPYDPSKDSIMHRARGMFNPDDFR